MSEHDGAASLVRSDDLLAAFQSELKRWRKSAMSDAPDSPVNRATINAVGVVADSIAIARAVVSLRAPSDLETCKAHLRRAVEFCTGKIDPGTLEAWKEASR